MRYQAHCTLGNVDCTEGWYQNIFLSVPCTDSLLQFYMALGSDFIGEEIWEFFWGGDSELDEIDS